MFWISAVVQGQQVLSAYNIINMNSCSVCLDNFIVNTKSIQCRYCQDYFHPHCVKQKDSVQKSLQESSNLFWFCTKCMPVVMDKLSSGIVGSPQHGQQRQAVTFTDPDFMKLRQSIEGAVTDAISSKITQLQGDSVAFREEMQRYRTEIRSDIKVLTESNKDLVRLLASSNPSLSCPASRVPNNTGEREQQSTHCDRRLKNDGNGPNSCAPSAPVKGKNRVQESGEVITSQNVAVQRLMPVGQPGSHSSSSKLKHITKGTGGSSDLLRPAPRGRNWVWIGGLARETTVKNILDYLRGYWSSDDILVYDLKSKGSKKSFKVGSVDLSVEELLSPNIWPSGILLKPFLFRKRNQSVSHLEDTECHFEK